MERAAELAGSWRILFAAKYLMEKDALPWVKPTEFELGASVENIALSGLGLLRPKGTSAMPALTAPILVEDPHPSSERSLLFLVDGSGSVTEGMHPLVNAADRDRRSCQDNRGQTCKAFPICKAPRAGSLLEREFMSSVFLVAYRTDVTS